MRDRSLAEDGFTLVELMVVVLIIAILVAVAVPVVASTQARAAERSCFSSIRTIEGSLAQYYGEQGEHGGPAITTVNIGTVLTSSIASGTGTYGPWLAEMPQCPTTGNYSVVGDGRTVNCSIHGHY